jgi:hypothetical protein
MDAEPPQPEDLGPRRSRVVAAAWCAGSGLVLGSTAVICLALGVVSGRQALAIGMPGALLLLFGLIAAAIADPASGQRLGYRAGLRAGALVSRWQSFLRRLRRRR